MLEILFHYGPFTLRTFNVLVAIGILFTGAFALRYVALKKLSPSFLSYALPILVVATLAGGRAAYVLEYSYLFRGQWASAFFFWDLRLSFFGCLYALTLALWALALKKKEDPWAWLDGAMLSVLTMMLFVHIGHFFNGTHYGLRTDLPWGIAFDSQNVRFLSPVHPTQIYAALITLAALLHGMKESKRMHLSGVVASKALMLYCLGMLGVDFLHGSPSLYAKISFGALAGLSFIALIHCSHKSHPSAS